MPAAAVVMIAGLLIAVGCGGEAVVSRTVFSVEGMHCDSCSTGIVGTLEKLEGVISVSADHEEGFAEAVYRQREVGVDELEAAIEKLGFTVVGVTTEIVDS
jgi:copper chaperone CopZ